MRTLKRNLRDVSYETVIGTEPIKDAYGNDTLQVRKLYASPVTTRWNISAAVGEEANEIVQRQSLYLIREHTLGDDGIEGIDNEQSHGGNDSEFHKEPEIRPPFLTESLLHLDSTSPVSATYRLTRLARCSCCYVCDLVRRSG